MEKRRGSQTGKLVFCAFVFLALGYAFAHYLTLVSWLCNKTSGSGYYEYYVNGVKMGGGGGPFAILVFLIFGIFIPAILFDLIIRKLDKVMGKKRVLPGDYESQRVFLSEEREASDRSYYTATFILTIVFAVITFSLELFLRYRFINTNPAAILMFSPRQPQYLFLLAKYISRGSMIICSLFSLWGRNAYGKPKKLLHYGTISVAIAIIVNIFCDYFAIRSAFAANFLNIRFASQTLLYLAAAATILILRKNNANGFVLTTFLSIGVLLLSTLILTQFRINIFDFLLSAQVVPTVFLSIALSVFGSRLNEIGRLFN